MHISRHGLSIGMERTGDEFFLSLKAQGKLTHEDYKIITPIIDSALAKVNTPKVKVLFDGLEFEGWEARAAWDDFKIGLKHGSEFEKIAILGNKKWLEWAANIGRWFIAGDIQYFENEHDAITWLSK